MLQVCSKRPEAILMKLYHLDWEVARTKDVLFDLISPGRREDTEFAAGGEIFDMAKTAFEGDCYKLVAEIDADNLEYAWRYTQHLDEAWNEDPATGIKPTGEGPFRSSAVGDLIEKDGEFFYVHSFGFKALPSFGSTPAPKI
jgi:hypothetical protein